MKIKLPISIALITGSIIFTSCKSTSEKSFSSSNNVLQIDTRANKFNIENYQEDIAAYKQESAEKIAANIKKITAFKSSIEYQKANATNNYKNEVLVMERKNIDLEKRIDSYKEDGQYKWQAFKVEFTNEMNEFGRQLNGLLVENTKKIPRNVYLYNN